MFALVGGIFVSVVMCMRRCKRSLSWEADLAVVVV